MTRVTLSEFKLAARDRSVRRSAAVTAARPPVTPMPQAQAAIRRYHQQGHARATAILRQTFDRSSYWGPNGKPSPRGWANAILSCFDTYVRLADADTRRAIMTPIKRDVVLGRHSIGVSPDVVLIDRNGYVGRLVLWDTPAPTPDEAELLAAPVALALDAELGHGRTMGVEVWHLRSSQQFNILAEDAFDRVAELTAVLRAYLE